MTVHLKNCSWEILATNSRDKSECALSAINKEVDRSVFHLAYFSINTLTE